MRKNSVKNSRINGEVQRVLAEVIRGEIKDPRIAPMTSVVDVEVASDLKTCRAYISVLGSEEEAAATLEGLKSAGVLSADVLQRKSICAIHPRFILLWISPLSMVSTCRIRSTW